MKNSWNKVVALMLAAALCVSCGVTGFAEDTQTDENTEIVEVVEQQTQEEPPNGDYFNIIIADSQDVTIQSRNTGHYWYLHCAGYPTEEALVIFHKHRFKDGYHQHGHARSLRQAIKSIVRHDDYQLNVRKCV